MHTLVEEFNGRLASMIYLMDNNLPSDVATARKKLYSGSSAPRGYLDGSQMPFDDLYEISAMRNNVNDRLAIESPLEIELSSSDSKCFINVKNTSNSDVSGKLYVILLENNISVPQADWPVKVAHGIPRKAINDAEGESVSLNPGESFSDTYTFTMNSSWKKENCQCLALVQKSDNEVVQVSQVDLGTVGTIQQSLKSNADNILKVMQNNRDDLVKISFSLPKQSHTSIIIFNSKGKRVRHLNNSLLHGGSHSITWDLKDNSGLPVSKGIYFIQFKTGNKLTTGKIIL